MPSINWFQTNEFLLEMHAIDLKEEGANLWRRERQPAKALVLLLQSVDLRESSSMLCLSLSELGWLYVDMLKLDEAASTARRMLDEAHRYDTRAQTAIARNMLTIIEDERSRGLHYGSIVKLQDTGNRKLDGMTGLIRGRNPDDKYRVEIDSKMHVVQPTSVVDASPSFVNVSDDSVVRDELPTSQTVKGPSDTTRMRAKRQPRRRRS